MSTPTKDLPDLDAISASAGSGFNFELQHRGALGRPGIARLREGRVARFGSRGQSRGAKESFVRKSPTNQWEPTLQSDRMSDCILGRRKLLRSPQSEEDGGMRSSWPGVRMVALRVGGTPRDRMNSGPLLFKQSTYTARDRSSGRAPPLPPGRALRNWRVSAGSVGPQVSTPVLHARGPMTT